MPCRFGFLVLAACCLSPIGTAQEITGRGTFPQYRSVSGLPGGGYAVRPDGRIGIDGALALSTPVAYSLHGGVYAGILANMSPNLSLRGFDSKGGEKGSNGTFVDNIGIGTEFGNITLGGLRLSSRGDGVFICHWQIPEKMLKLPQSWGETALGVGIQDVLSQGGSSGEELDRQNGGGKSNSPYVVLTRKFEKGMYASAGIGTTRFRTAFANISAPIGKRIRGYAEFDGFAINVGVTGQLHRNLQVSAGVVRGKNVYWAVGIIVP